MELFVKSCTCCATEPETKRGSRMFGFNVCIRREKSAYNDLETEAQISPPADRLLHRHPVGDAYGSLMYHALAAEVAGAQQKL